MIMTTSRDMDAQRQRYADELAAYTRRQWMLAQQALELSRAQGTDKPPSQQNGRKRDESQTGRSSQGQKIHPSQAVRFFDGVNAIAGIQSHDYAHRSRRHGGNVGHDSRAVAANW